MYTFIFYFFIAHTTTAIIQIESPALDARRRPIRTIEKCITEADKRQKAIQIAIDASSFPIGQYDYTSVAIACKREKP